MRPKFYWMEILSVFGGRWKVSKTVFTQNRFNADGNLIGSLFLSFSNRRRFMHHYPINSLARNAIISQRNLPIPFKFCWKSLKYDEKVLNFIKEEVDAFAFEKDNVTFEGRQMTWIKMSVKHRRMFFSTPRDSPIEMKQLLICQKKWYSIKPQACRSHVDCAFSEAGIASDISISTSSAFEFIEHLNSNFCHFDKSVHSALHTKLDTDFTDTNEPTNHIWHFRLYPGRAATFEYFYYFSKHQSVRIDNTNEFFNIIFVLIFRFITSAITKIRVRVGDFYWKYKI